MLSWLLLKLLLVNHADRFTGHFPTVSEINHFRNFSKTIEEVGFDLDLVFLCVVEHLLAVFLAGDEGAFDADIAEDESGNATDTLQEVRQ